MQTIPLVSNYKDGQVGDGVYAAYQWRIDDITGNRELMRMYLGTRWTGVVLQWQSTEVSETLWDGREERRFNDGAWTPCYSRGNFGRNYACGGNWSGHTLGLNPNYKRQDKVAYNIEIIGKDMIEMPECIKASIASVTDMDVKVGWAIWYNTARDAFNALLREDALKRAMLPSKTIELLSRPEVKIADERLREVLDIYHL